jgi:tetratricopeptide (TPR) repeat protein
VPVLQDYMKAYSGDVDGPGNLASCLLKLKRYSEAATYEAAVKISGDRANLHASLGSAYLLAGDREKAGAALSKLADADPKGNYFNDVAYQMANADLRPPLALGYAKKAVRAAEDESHQITLPDLKVEDVRRIFKWQRTGTRWAG